MTFGLQIAALVLLMGTSDRSRSDVPTVGSDNVDLPTGVGEPGPGKAELPPQVDRGVTREAGTNGSFSRAGITTRPVGAQSKKQRWWCRADP